MVHSCGHSALVVEATIELTFSQPEDRFSLVELTSQT